MHAVSQMIFMTGDAPRRVMGVAGWKNSGKTTFVERLVTELSGRGHTVSTIKRAHHDADVDHAGTDTYRHRQAGAREVMLVTGNRWVLMHELRGDAEPKLDDLLGRLSPADLTIVEGFKHGNHPKIEVRRSGAADQEPLPSSANVIAIAADHDIEGSAVPAFHLDDIAAIADFIEIATSLR